jgi:nicotinate-nucleotide adenylyltransferase
MTTWAIFGGSFDPPHVGHVLAASWVLSTHDVDALVVVPVFAHPFGKDMTPYPHRRRMCELAFSTLSRAHVSDIEARLGGASYTVRTLEALRSEASLRLIVGTDIIDDIPRWKEGHRIAELAPLIVVGRGGHDDGLPREVVMPEISSTEVRTRLREGRSCEGLVPRAVLAHIDRYQLYR